jgi:predicted nucleotidyltransferase
MKFKIEKREKKVSNYLKEDLDLARKFAKTMWSEFGNFIRGMVLFGSAVKHPNSKANDLDILIIVDDVRFKFSRPLIETYRIITARKITEIAPKRLHVQSMKFTSFWEYVRAGDPVAVNILRHGTALIDTGFFDPLQVMLDQGRIRPTEESIWTYFTLAPASLTRSKNNLLNASIDLYWAAIDAAHAALMANNEIPPSPEHVADMLERKLVAKKHLAHRYAHIMRQLYAMFKGIIHRDIKEIPGKEYDKFKALAEEFVDGMKEYIEKRRNI